MSGCEKCCGEGRGRQGKGLRQCRLGDKVIPKQRSEGSQGVRYVCIEAAPMDRERGRGDSPDERVSLSTSQASVAGAQ